MKYYYTDPLAAAWMAKHFGMQFSFDGGMKYEEIWNLSIDSEPPFYIHPDSLHLLEQQVGDAVQISTGTCWKLHDTQNLAESERYPSLRIIQRNGVVFMWPETEA